MLDPITAITIAGATIKTIRTCVDDSEKLWASLKKYAGAIEDAREYVRQEKQFGKSKPGIYKTLHSKDKKPTSASEEAFNIIICEEKIRQHEKELYQFFTANWTADWGGRSGWLRFRKLREDIRAKKERQEFAAIRRRKQFLYNSKLGTVIGVLLVVLIYLSWFLYNAIVESSK